MQSNENYYDEPKGPWFQLRIEESKILQLGLTVLFLGDTRLIRQGASSCQPPFPFSKILIVLHSEIFRMYYYSQVIGNTQTLLIDSFRILCTCQNIPIPVGILTFAN